MNVFAFLDDGPRVKVVLRSPEFVRLKDVVVEISKAWMERLAQLVTYEVDKKFLLIQEETRQLSPLIYKGEPVTLAVSFCWDKDGKFINPAIDKDKERVKRGDFSVIEVRMLTDNWEGLLVTSFEKALVHRLLHVADPYKAGLRSDGLLAVEDDSVMEEWVTQVLTKFGSLADIRSVVS
jgi:hypothetical protein